MRDYNSNKNKDEQVYFYGMDIQNVQNINKEINRKWKKKNHTTTKGEYFLVFSFKKEELNKEILSKIKSLTNSLRGVSVDVYDYKTALIVIKDFKNKEKANFARARPLYVLNNGVLFYLIKIPSNRKYFRS